MAYKKKSRKVAKAEVDEGLVGCCFAIVGVDTKVAAEGDVQAKLQDGFFLVKFFGRDDKAPHMKVVPIDAFIMRPAQPLWLFFSDEDALDEWLDEHDEEAGDAAEKDTANEPEAG